MFKKRKAGILVHPTSFPSDFGIGDLGKNAYSLIDFLYNSKQSFWQILPLNATTYSPYQAYSAFGRNFLLISPEKLSELNLLTKTDLKTFKVPMSTKIDYSTILSYKIQILRTAFENFKKHARSILHHGFDAFCSKNKDWLDDYVLFMSIKEYFSKKRSSEAYSTELEAFIEITKDLITAEEAKEHFYSATWVSWDSDIKHRTPEALSHYKDLLSDEINFYKFCEFIFDLQWKELKNYAHSKGIRIIGDIPIFVSHDSVDVWTNPELFYLDDLGFPTVVAGVPPDYFSEDGQLWGNPLYNWKVHQDKEYSWWIKRIKTTLTHVDAVRLDHFRGFDAYWETKFGEPTAKNGKWVTGPGRDLFSHMQLALGGLPFIAEDLGVITPDVEFLRDFFSLPGIAVIQFAFDGSKDNPYLPENIEDTTVVYTGTHDNNTTVGWFNSLTDAEKEVVHDLVEFDDNRVPYTLIETAYSTNANTVIIPLQDILELDETTRMNVPGTVEGNWDFRYEAEMLKTEYSKRLTILTAKYKRN